MRKLNTILEVFLYLVIIRHIIALFTTIPQIGMTISGYGSMSALAWNFVLHIAMIMILLNLLKIKRWALYLFGVIQLINIAFQSLFFGRDFWELTIVATILCAIMAALLCLRKDGISAWQLFFPKKEQTQKDELDIEFEMLQEKDAPKHKNISTEIPEDGINTPETTNDEIEDLTIDTLPQKEDGSLDYEKMTPIQQFAYTCKTESVEVALKDLNADIKVLEKKIVKVKKELSSLSGGNRAKLRDSLREEQMKLDKLYSLRNKHVVKKKWKFNHISALVLKLLLLFTFIIIGVIVYINTKEIQSDERIIIKKQESLQWKDEDLPSDQKRITIRDKVYKKLKSLGLTDSKDDFYKYFDSDENVRKDVYNRLREDGLRDSEEEFYKYTKPINQNSSIHKAKDNCNTVNYVDDLSKLYNELIKKGYTQDELGSDTVFYEKLCDADNRKILYEYVKDRNDFKIGEFNTFEKRILFALDRRWLYEKLSVKYDLGDYSTFYKKMDNEEKRKAIYPVAVDEGLDVGTWEEFNKLFSK